jgi:flagellar export protein FliJ
MSQYQFRLKSLQRFREVERDRHRARLADAYRAQDVLLQQREELSGQLESLRSQQRSATKGKYADLDTLQVANRYEPVLRAQAQVLAEQHQMLAAEVERRREALTEANRDVRALELLDERRRQEHEREQQRAETKQLDEIACIRSWRQRNRQD